jgi:hypothetical protein
MLELGGARPKHPAEIPAPAGTMILLDLPDGVGDVADHLDLREIDGIDLGGLVLTWITSVPPCCMKKGGFRSRHGRY